MLRHLFYELTAQDAVVFLILSGVGFLGWQLLQVGDALWRMTKAYGG